MSADRKDPRDAWDRLAEMAEAVPEDSTPEQIDARIREAGGDPEAIAARGRALAAQLLEKRARLGWRAGAQEKLDAARALAASRPSRKRLPRVELLARIEALRSDPRAASRVVVAYRSRKPEEATEDELASLLEEMELLAALDD